MRCVVFVQTMQSMAIRRYWQRRMILGINLGGLAAGVFLLTRTEFPFIPETPWSSMSDVSKKNDRPAEPMTPTSKQMSAERQAAIQMAKDLTSRPWKDRSTNTDAEKKKTYQVQRPQMDYRVEEKNMENKRIASNKAAAAGEGDDVRDLKSNSEPVGAADEVEKSNLNSEVGDTDDGAKEVTSNNKLAGDYEDSK